MRPPRLEIDGLAITLAGRRVLDAVTAAAEPGTITAVVGPNAAGKSTLLRAAAGLLPPAAGAVRIGGDAVHRIPGRTLAARVAWAPPRPSVALPFTVREVVAMGRHAVGGSAAAVERAIDAMDLADVAGRRWPELSTGQQQRTAIARVLAQRDGQGPGVVLLDEPAGPLDLRHAERLGGVLRRLAADGSIVVLAIHDLARAAEWADRVWVLDAGRLVAAGAVVATLSAERIEAVFGVAARWVAVDGRSRLIPGVSPRA